MIILLTLKAIVLPQVIEFPTHVDMKQPQLKDLACTNGEEYTKFSKTTPRQIKYIFCPLGMAQMVESGFGFE